MTAVTPIIPAADAAGFRAVARHWASGCAVVTTRDGDGEPQGATVTALTSLSLDPMQFLVCLDRRTRSLAAIRARGGFAINILAADQAAIARRFAGSGSEKFAGLGYRDLDGLPILAGTLAHLACRVARISDGGDHEIIIGDVIALGLGKGEPLLHYHGGFGRFAAEG